MNYVLRLSDAFPWWGVAAIGLIVFWIVIQVNTVWRCRKCGRLMLGGLDKAAFCVRCGAPRPRGPNRGPVPITVEARRRFPREVRDRVSEILTAENLADALPAGTSAKATIVAEIEQGTTIAFAHPTWKPESVGVVGGLPPYPRRPVLETLPRGIMRVEIDAVERTSGGMSSHFGFIGIYASLLVSLTERKIWDARAEEAP